MHEYRNCVGKSKVLRKTSCMKTLVIDTCQHSDVRLLFFRMWISLTRGSRWLDGPFELYLGRGKKFNHAKILTTMTISSPLAPFWHLKKQWFAAIFQLNTPRGVAWDFVGVRLRTGRIGSLSMQRFWATDGNRKWTFRTLEQWSPSDFQNNRLC